jgi:hypothetical protein
LQSKKKIGGLPSGTSDALLQKQGDPKDFG